MATPDGARSEAASPAQGRAWPAALPHRRAFHFSSPRAKMTAQVKAVRQRASAPRGKGVQVPRSFHYCKRRREDIAPLSRQDAGAGRRPRGGIASQETCPRAAAGTPGTGERRLFPKSLRARAEGPRPWRAGPFFVVCFALILIFLEKGVTGGGPRRLRFVVCITVNKSRRKS